MSNVVVSIALTETPSRSKGWGAYKCPALEGADASKLIYAGRDIGLDAGATVTVDVWNSCRTKSGKEDKGCATFALVVEEGATAVLSHKEGSQRTTVTVTGARLVEVAS